MPQTIQIYRGTQNIAHNTNVALFTNTATGFATRLRLGYMCFQVGFSNVFGYLSIGVIRSGGTQPVLIGGANSFTQNRSISLMPHDTFTNYALNTSTNGGPSLYNAGLNFQDSVVIDSGANANINKGWHITDVMIGPSDVIQAGWKDGGGGSRACDVEFCYIGITET